MKLKVFVLAILLGGVFFYLARPYLKWAIAIQEDSRKRFQLAKKAVQKIGFKGVVVVKKICPKCHEDAVNQVSIDFLCSENCIMFPYPPRFGFDYEIENQKILTMGVPKHVYEIITIGDSITKPQNSNIIQINGANYQLLSEDSTKWLQ
jgi:hypothetical protein